MTDYPARFGLAITAALCAGATSAFAQPADLSIPPAKTTEYPAGISVAKVGPGSVYVNSDGRTLYGLDLRTVHRWTTNPAMYCRDRCSDWEPLLAPPGMAPNVAPALQARFNQPVPGQRTGGGQGAVPTRGVPPTPNGLVNPQQAPDWGVIQGPAGPQWVYKGWHMVYVRKGDRPRSTQYDGAEAMTWNTLKFVPPVPKLPAPSGIVPVFRDGAYVLADKDGRLLYTGRCNADCSTWRPLGAGLASQGLGDWTVDRAADDPQWLYRGQPVFIGAEAGTAGLPKSATMLRP